MKQPTVKARNNEFLGTIMNNIENKPTTIKLNPRVEQIHLADSDTSEEQKEQLIRIMNKYEMCFANNLMELGRTSVLEYDIETVPDIKPIRMKNSTNKMRMCNDVRKLNDKTILQPYPMLNMNYLLADIGKRKCKYFSLIDLSDSYRQIPLTKR